MFVKIMQSTEMYGNLNRFMKFTQINEIHGNLKELEETNGI